MWNILLLSALLGFTPTALGGGPDENEDNTIVSSTPGVHRYQQPSLLKGVAYVPKCCPVNQTAVRSDNGEGMPCKDSDLPFKENLMFWTEKGQDQPKRIHLLIGEQCKDGSYRLEPHEDSQDEFHLFPNGTLYLPNQTPQYISFFEYCLDSFVLDDGSVAVLPLVCFPPQPAPDWWTQLALILYPIGSLTSIPFLIATVLIYFLLDELRTIQGNVLCCYSLCLAMGYLCLATVQIWGDVMEITMCKTIAFMLQFFFIACFFWLNIMCYHTWKKTKNDILLLRSMINERLRFIIYSLYGWGFPLIILAVSLVMDFIPTIPPSYIKPNIGSEACWFKSDDATLSYFYGPISILLGVNVVFFLLTIKYLHTSKKRLIHMQDVATQVMIHRKRQLYIQCLLLFCMMGLNWILEVLSWKFGKPPQLWIVIDCFNTLQGVVIFLVFVVFDIEARKVLRRRWAAWRGTKRRPEEVSLKT